ncbi:hypothetical protein TCON_1768 [Astathelohania contejeani]|uniref:Uncharacterized protein n=1 Tax=Astathelohania contejeani TaxID=164912 RepID=A0ABQ7HXV6_9MICR|nr:hypothetical protein TCON_1768 [Thelohania contejeani]
MEISYEEIIRNARIEKKEPINYPEIEITDEEIYSNTINSIESFQDMCEHFDFPILSSDILNDPNKERLMTYLQNIQLEYKRYGIELDINDSYFNVESECDKYEIQIARLHNELSNYKKLNEFDKSELEYFLSLESLKEVKDVIYKIIDGVPITTMGKECSAILAGLLLRYRRYRRKSELIEAISNKNDSVIKKIILRLLDSEWVSVDELVIITNVNRITLLKDIYYLLNKEIVYFDRLNGTIKLAK